jgi:hypothetical protein
VIVQVVAVATVVVAGLQETVVVVFRVSVKLAEAVR